MSNSDRCDICGRLMERDPYFCDSVNCACRDKWVCSVGCHIDKVNKERKIKYLLHRIEVSHAQVKDYEECGYKDEAKGLLFDIELMNKELESLYGNGS